MSERLGTHTHDREPDEPEISDEEKREIIDSARAITLPTSHPLDRFGSYMTKFIQPGQMITIHVPALFQFIPEVAPLHHSVQIIKHVPEDLEDNVTVVHITSYTINERTLTTEYYEGDEYFNTTTLERLRSHALDSTDALVEAHMLEHEVDLIPPITRTQLPALRDLLESLSPDQIS